MAPRVSIVVPVFNRADLTLQCMTSLAECTDDVPFEVIIVDNGSTDGTAEVLAALEGDVTVLRNPENRGFGEACNQGAAAATAEYVLFLNNDTVLTPGWLPPLVAALDEDPRRAAVQPKLLYPDGRLNDAGGLVFAGGDAWVYGKGSPFPAAPIYSYRRAPDYASGACLLVRKSAFDEVGGFDPRYAPAYYEDTDLSFAFRAAGWTVLYEPASIVIHLEGGTAGTDEGQGLKAYQVRNKERFAEKWAAELQTRPVLDPDRVEAWAHRAQGGFGPGEEVAPAVSTVPAESAWAAAGSRAQQRRRILVVDGYPPMYDRASGSLRTFQLVRCLRAAGHSVAYYGDTCVERSKYAAALSRIGVPLYGEDPEEAALARELPEDAAALWTSLHTPPLEALASRHNIDTILITPWAIAERVLPQLRQAFPAATLVVDSCDLHFLREERAAKLTGDPEAVAAAAERKDHELAVYRAADAVVCVSAKEAEVLTAELPDARVAVVGNAHDELPAGPGYAERSGLIFVGNADHTPNLDAVLWWAEEIAPRLAALLPGVSLTVVGNDPRGLLDPLRNVAFSGLLEVLGWVPETLPYLQRARVSVAPLRFGAGVKGKVGEALAAGLPVVGTSIAVEGMGLRAGEHVLVADDAEAFAAEVARLYQDAELWERLRAAGRDEVSGSAGLAVMAAAAAELVADPERSDWTAVPAPWGSPFHHPPADTPAVAQPPSTGSAPGPATPGSLRAAEHERARDAAQSEFAGDRLDAAATHLREAVANWGGDASTLSDLAVIETARGSLDAASEAVDAALALDPQHVDARVNRLCLDLLTGRRQTPTRVAIDWPMPVPPDVLSLGSSPNGAAVPARLGDLPLQPGTLEFVLVGSESLAGTAASDVLREAIRSLTPGGQLVIGSPPPGPAQAEHLAAQLRALGLDVTDGVLGLIGVHRGAAASESGAIAQQVSDQGLTSSATSGVRPVRTAPGERVRVNLACGDDRRAGWLNVDAHTPADLNMDVLDLRFEDGSVDEILLSHALEHFSESDFRRVLKECRRVLSRDGRLLVNVPELDWVMRNWLALPEEKRWDWALASVFGLQDNPGEFHRTGFSAPRLERVLREAGFADVRVAQIFSHGQGCLWAEAYTSRIGPAPTVSALLSPNTAEGLDVVLNELQRILPEGADLVVSERPGTAGAVLTRASMPITWLYNADGITEDEGLAQAASVARAERVLPVRFGRTPDLRDIVSRDQMATRPEPVGLIPDAVADWKIYVEP